MDLISSNIQTICLLLAGRFISSVLSLAKDSTSFCGCKKPARPLHIQRMRAGFPCRTAVIKPFDPSEDLCRPIRR